MWRYRIRTRDSNDTIIATYEDYKDAENFFNAIKGHGTPRELKVLQAIKNLQREATREKIMEKTGFSKGDLSDILYGRILYGRSRDGQAKYGLLHKCPALTEEDEGLTKRIVKTPGQPSERRFIDCQPTTMLWRRIAKRYISQMKTPFSEIVRTVRHSPE